MKRIYLYGGIVAIGGLLFLGFDRLHNLDRRRQQAWQAPIDALYQGEHRLHRLTAGIVRTTTVPAHGDLFLLFGSFTGEQRTTDTVITFAWETVNHVYVLSQLPWQRVRVQLCDVCVPTVRFRWTPTTVPPVDFTSHIQYAVVTLSTEAWPVQPPVASELPPTR